MKALITVVIIFLLYKGNDALPLLIPSKSFQCYNCTSNNQQSSCTETCPLTSYLKVTQCHTNCYKWILYSYNHEVRRGCRLPGAGPPGLSYDEYMCDNNLCNHASSVLVSTKTLFAMMTSAILYLYVTRD